MENRWNTPSLGVYPTCVLLVVLLAIIATIVIIPVAGANPGEVLLAAALITTAVIAAITLLYLIARLTLRWIRRTRTDRIIVGHIASLVRQKLPLADGLMLAAGSERGVAARHLARVAEPLAAGFTLAESIRIGWPECPGLVQSLIMAGERAGQLTMPVEQAERYVIQRTRWCGGLDTPVIPYAVCVVGLTCLVTSGLMIAVVPKFKEIFKDFGVNLPEPTLTLINIAMWFAQGGWLLLLPLAAASCAGVYLGLRPRRVPQPLLTSRIADSIRWRTPGIRRLEWSSGLAAALRTIGMGLHAGMDFPAAVRLASDLDVNAELRDRLVQFAVLAEQGVDLRQAAERAELGRVAGLALASGLRGHDMHAAIRYAADYHDALICRWWIVARSLFWPITTLVLGTMVAFVVLSFFLPLRALIDGAVGYFP